jgi:hypothetical protein
VYEVVDVCPYSRGMNVITYPAYPQNPSKSLKNHKMTPQNLQRPILKLKDGYNTPGRVEK